MAGEMTQKEIEVGGDWYPTRERLENAAKSMGSKRFETKPFDQYQGPFCFMNDLQGSLWATDEEEVFIFEAARSSGLVEYEKKEGYHVNDLKELGNSIKNKLKMEK